MCKYTVLFSVVFLVCAAEVQAKIDVRVLLLENRGKIDLKFNAPVVVRNADTGKELWKGRPEKISFTPAGEQIQMGQEIFPFNTIIVESGSPMTVAKRSYRGIFQIWNQGSQKLVLVNILDIESYLCGIMKAEISPRWPIPAIKAQAVVARSYALYKREGIRAKTDRPYDLTSDVLSQVYVGVAGEHERSDQAVADTAGEVLISRNGTVMETLYHACCGGSTEAAKEVWGGTSDLESVLCHHCVDSPHYNWQAKISIPEFVETWFGKTGGNIFLEPARLSSTGRWQDIRIRYGNQSKVVRGVDFRRRMGVDIIRSTRFQVRIAEGEINFSGKGWGHGVGLCQWGAKGMIGATYKEILRFYYPSSRLVGYISHSPNDSKVFERKTAICIPEYVTVFNPDNHPNYRAWPDYRGLIKI